MPCASLIAVLISFSPPLPSGPVRDLGVDADDAVLARGEAVAWAAAPRGTDLQARLGGMGVARLRSTPPEDSPSAPPSTWDPQPIDYESAPVDPPPQPTTPPAGEPPSVPPSTQYEGHGYDPYAQPPPDSGATVAGRRRRWGGGDGPRETLFGDGTKGLGAHIDVALKVTSVDRDPALMMGGNFGFIIADRLHMGLGWNWLVTPQPTTLGPRRFNLEMNYGGFQFGVFVVRHGFFRMMLGSHVGGGSACLDDERLNRCYAKAQLFTGEPEVTFIFSVLKIMRIALAGGYRFVVPQRWSGPTGAELGGPTGTFAIQFGAFDSLGRKDGRKRIRW